ncbi:helix-turn-helix domain-containing protein [Enterococcus casseliflavus]|uniref:helix-turn-helix domain-containing protein n=1 Tax=Enterococcus TaxID=1350 RepID=UPI00143295F5|nr:helix-turn-helix domain-containing protein [Enterococcus casseliflavus]MDB1688422.1 helix-turn-helix domain-containing protein [Enterococcus casseliflavus]NKD30547.1 M protein trans-acting positive regulator [Enterococcus casseliflavus]
MKNFQLKFIKNRSLIRRLQLLNEFEKNPSSTLGDLSEVTKSSTRTIIADIAMIREHFNDAIEIYSSKFGYLFEELDPEAYIKQKQNLVKDEPFFMILESIFFDELQSVLDWSLTLNLSEQALLGYLKKMNGLLKPFNLRLSTNPVTLVGSEIDIRRFFCLFYYESDINVNTIFPSLDVQDAVIEITNLLHSKKQPASTFSYFSYILYITLERSKKGLQVELSPELKEIFYAYDSLISPDTLTEILYSYFHYRLPEDEIIYLLLCLICRRKINHPSIEEFCQSYNRWPEIKQVAKDFYAINRGNSYDEQKDLHWLESFFTIVKIRDMLSPIMNVNIDDLTQFVKDKFSHEYKRNYAFLAKHKLVKKLYSPSYLEDFCASLTIHMEAIKEENWGTQRTIAVIFEGNEYVCEYAESIVRKYLGRFHTLYYPDASELSPAYLKEKQIDLLVTNYSEYTMEYLLEVECILLKSFPDATDWNRLLNQINPRILRLVVLNNA